MTLLRRRIKDDRDLLVATEWMEVAKKLPDDEWEAIVEAIEAAQQQIRHKGLASLRHLQEASGDGAAVYDYTHGGHRVLLMDSAEGPCVLMVLKLRWIDAAPDPDDRCASCERWSGHPHADWCSTRCTCPDDAARHLPDCGQKD